MSEELYQDNKRIAKNTVYLYLRMIVSLVIGLYTSRVVLATLGVEDYGVYNIVGGFVSMFSLLTGAVISAAQRFITYELGTGNQEKLRKTFSTLFFILIILSTIILLLGEFLGQYLISRYLNIPENRLDAAYFVFHCSLFVFIVNLFSVPYIGCVIAHERINFYAFLSIGESFFKLIIVFILYLTIFDRLKVYSVLLLLIGIITCLVYGFYCIRHFQETKFSLKVDKSIFKEIFSYSMWVTFSGCAMVGKEQGVNMLINIFFGVTMNAARGISLQIFGVISQFANSLATSINPQITKNYASGNLQRSIKLTFVLAKAQGVMLLILSLPVLLETDYILGLWLDNVPYYTSVFTRWIIVLGIVSTLRNAHGALYLATGKVRTLEIVGGGIILLNLPFSYIALKMGCEPVSTVMIGVILEALCLVVCYAYLKFILGFPLLRFFIEIIFPLCAVMFLSLIVPWLIRYYWLGEGFMRFFWVGVTCVIGTIVTSYIIAFNTQEKQMVIDVVRKRIKLREC